jgi:hypothetical protein
MVITKLQEYLLPLLDDADEIWIAKALVTDDGYQRIQLALASFRQHLLNGVDLLTSSSVLYSIRGQLQPGFL